jgi:hypothetical protein
MRVQVRGGGASDRWRRLRAVWIATGEPSLPPCQAADYSSASHTRVRIRVSSSMMLEGFGGTIRSWSNTWQLTCGVARDPMRIRVTKAIASWAGWPIAAKASSPFLELLSIGRRQLLALSHPHGHTRHDRHHGCCSGGAGVPGDGAVGTGSAGAQPPPGRCHPAPDASPARPAPPPWLSPLHAAPAPAAPPVRPL